MTPQSRQCEVPPEGWTCSRAPGHDGPCAASPATMPLPKLDDRHVADLHYFLARTLADAIPRMAAMGHGFPPMLTFEGWQAILAEMAEGFAKWAEKSGEALEEEALPALNRSLDLLREWFPHLWD